MMLSIIGGCFVGGALKGWHEKLKANPNVQLAKLILTSK